jgi:hypothetical protein
MFFTALRDAARPARGSQSSPFSSVRSCTSLTFSPDVFAGRFRRMPLPRTRIWVTERLYLRYPRLLSFREPGASFREPGADSGIIREPIGGIPVDANKNVYLAAFCRFCCAPAISKLRRIGLLRRWWWCWWIGPFGTHGPDGHGWKSAGRARVDRQRLGQQLPCETFDHHRRTLHTGGGSQRYE